MLIADVNNPLAQISIQPRIRRRQNRCPLRNLQFGPICPIVPDGVFLAPVPEPVKIATLSRLGVEIRNGHMIGLSPVVRDDLRAGLAHQLFQEDMQTVVLVVEELGRLVPRLAVVMLPVDLFAELVEAVDQVEDVDLGEVEGFGWEGRVVTISSDWPPGGDLREQGRVTA